jgi:hypothetical protein
VELEEEVLLPVPVLVLEMQDEINAWVEDGRRRSP